MSNFFKPEDFDGTPWLTRTNNIKKVIAEKANEKRDEALEEIKNLLRQYKFLRGAPNYDKAIYEWLGKYGN